MLIPNPLAAREASGALEATLQLPVGNATVVFELLPFGGVDVVVDHIAAESSPQHLRGAQRLGRLTQRLGDLAQPLAVIGVADESGLELELLLDAREASREQGSEGEVRVEVGAADTALDADAPGILAAQAKTRGAVVNAPHRLRR